LTFRHSASWSCKKCRAWSASIARSRRSWLTSPGCDPRPPPVSVRNPRKEDCSRMAELPVIKRLRKESEVLKHELTVELPKELERARAHGDLSENAEYAMAKQRQELLRARLPK